MSAYGHVLDALQDRVKVTQRGANARAQCPAHNSRGMSLLVTERDDGVGVHCFAGCPVDDVVAALGLTMRDLFDDNSDDWQRPVGWKPRPAPNPLGDPDHFFDRILQQERLEADPAWRARRAAELAAAVAPRPGDFRGVGR